MATMRNRTRQRLRTYPEPEPMFLGGIGKFFGKVGKGIWEGVRGVGDFALGAIGAPDIIDNTFVDRSKFLTGLNNVVGSVGRSALNVVAPGAGSALGFAGRSLNQLGVQQPQQQNQAYQQPFGSQGLGQGLNYLPMMGNIAGIFNQLANVENNNSQASGPSQGSSGFGGGFFNVPQFNPGMVQSPGFAGGSFGFGQPQGGGGGFGNTLSSLGSIASLLGSIGAFESGGPVRKYQSGGLVDIQAEKGELILHPTGYLTPVHARRSHAKMERSGDGDMITDHPLEGSFIFSDFLKIDRKDADDLVVGIKRYPYEEGKRGKEPVVYSVGDLFNKREKRKTPAQLAQRIANTFKVTNDEEDIFNLMGDQLNIQNRIPYLQGISMLSEIQREKSDQEEQIAALGEGIFAKKGGVMKSRRVYHPIRSHMAQTGGGIGMFGTLPPVDIFGTQTGPQFPGVTPPFAPNSGLGVPGVGVPKVLPDFGSFGNYPDPTSPLPSLPSTLPGSVSSTTPGVGTFVDDLGDAIDGIRPGGFDDMFGPGLGPNDGTGGQQQFMTQMVDQGSPFLRGFGRAAIPIGGGINFGANVAGAIGSYRLNNNLVNENRTFFEGQRGLANQSRDIASQGNLFDVGLNFLQQGPVDQEQRFSSRVRQFDPFRQVNVARQMADQSIGQINSMIRNNPGGRGVAIGDAIASSNQGIAAATSNALGQQFQIDRFLDDEDFFNQGVTTGNQQRRVDFGNSLIQGARPGFAGFFQNEASRPLDMLGLNSAERQADIMFRQNRLFQPISFLSTAGNSLANVGASALALGTNFQPQQVPVNQGQGGGGGFNLGNTINSIGSIANVLGSIFEKGGRVKR